MHLLGVADCVVASYVFVIETCVYLSIYLSADLSGSFPRAALVAGLAATARLASAALYWPFLLSEV
jgi:hypothetical protein